MKHICHITTVHPERDTRIFYKECKSLARAGFEVKLLVVNGESFEEDGVKVIGVPCDFNGRLQRFRKASKAVYNKAVSLDADVYHFHDPEFLSSAAKLVKRGKKVIYDVHEDLPRQMLNKHYIPKLFRRSFAAIVERNENKHARKMSGIITATDFIKDRFMKFHQRVEAIKNYPILPENIHEKRQEKKQSNEIVYVGSITRERGLTELIQALPLLRQDIRLNLAGKYAPEAYREDLTKLDGWQKVNEIGFANRKKVDELFGSSFAGIVTLHPIINYLDALPVKMFEYMAAGMPVIASDFPLWKEIVEGNKCGVCVDPLKPEAIAEAILYLYDNQKEATQMGFNGKKAIKAIYNWSVEEEKLVAFYKQILNG